MTATKKKKATAKPSLADLIAQREALNTQIVKARIELLTQPRGRERLTVAEIRDSTPTIKAAVMRLLEQAAEGCTYLDYGSPIEQIVCEIMSPECSSNQRNWDAFIRLISCLHLAAKVASETDWDLVCDALKRHIYLWSDAGLQETYNYTRPLELKPESEARP
jgi:hypothetical protein